MLKLNPIRSEKVWGYEDWIASTHPNGLQENFASAIAGKNGQDYPLLVKVIQANDSLSVQVHPDDEWAVKLEGKGSRGKTECWYVLDAEPNAKLVYGLNGAYSKDALSKAIETKSLEQNLNFVPVKKGDFVFIPAGTVHAIGGGLRLLEVQQSCDITYRLYDWGRPRELHVEKGLSVIKNEGLEKIAQFDEKFECEYFALAQVDASQGASLTAPEGDSPSDWQLLFVIEGNVKVTSSLSDDEIELKAEDIIAIAPGETVGVSGPANLMYICVA